jgi:uroporphyrinogen decarboxylase
MVPHRQAGRGPVTDSPWEATLERWRREGLPGEISFEDYFGLDRFAHIGVDNSPQFPEQTLEMTDTYTVTTTRWGPTLKNWRPMGGVPELLFPRFD